MIIKEICINFSSFIRGGCMLAQQKYSVMALLSKYGLQLSECPSNLCIIY